MVEEMPPLRSAGFVDPGWEHGTAQDEKKKKVKCNYCGKVVSGGIYRLKQHLARISGEVTYCERAPEEVFLKMRENLEGCRSNKKPRLSKSDERAYLNFHCHDNKAVMEDASYRRKGKKVLADKSLVINLTPLRSLGYVDPGWEHGVAQDERKRKVKCNYCGKIVSGGINRFKQHLARIPGEVAPCKYVPDEVYFKIKESMKWHRAGRRHRRLDVKEMLASHVHTDNELEEDEQEEDIVHHMEKEKVLDGDNRRSGAEYKTHFTEVPSGSDSQMCLNNCGSSNSSLKTPVSQIPVTYRQLKAGSIKKNQKEVLSAICQFFYHAGIPTSAANSLYFQKMLELVGQYGQGLSVPCSQLISGRLLQDEIATIKNHLPEFRACWAITGCSIVADSWKNTEGRTRINFLVSCPRGLYLVCSLDATDIADDASSLFKLLDKVVEEIGEENVVQVVTQSTPSYKAAGKMLEDKRKGLYWTPCVVYCIDQILEGFTKMKLVGECLANGQRITRFIYNHAWLLNLMKKEYTAGQELLRPAMTKCATGFGTLQCLVGHRIGLKRLFQSNKWLSSPLSKSDEGKEMETITLNATFWKKMQYVRKSVDPFLRVLQKVCSDGSLLMAYIHNDMHKAKLAIKSIHGDDARKYGPFWSVIDNHWSSLFHHPLCLAAYFLNPAFRYRPDYVANPEVMRGLNDCIVRLEQDSGKRISASIQISDFVSAKADFGTELAISTRAELDPAAWWQQHGISCLELQRIAVRILSQTCTAFGCEHNWSVYDHVYTERRNRLAQKKLSDLVYVHYNLRLREHQQRRINDKFSLDNVLMEGLLDDWIGEADKQVIQHDEDVLDIKDGYDSNTLDYKDGDVDIRKGEPLPMATLTEAEPLNVHPAADAATDDDSNLDFLDDGFSD